MRVALGQTLVMVVQGAVAEFQAPAVDSVLAEAFLRLQRFIVAGRAEQGLQPQDAGLL